MPNCDSLIYLETSFYLFQANSSIPFSSREVEDIFSLSPTHQESQVMASCLAIGDSMESIKILLICPHCEHEEPFV